MHIATISSKNQITIPVRLLKKLGLKAGNKIIIDEKNGQLNAKPVKTSIVDELAGSLNTYIDPKKLGKSWLEVKEEAATEYAKYLVKKYNLPKKLKKK